MLTRPETPELRWDVAEDGSFSLLADDAQIDRAYPGIDGVPLRPLGVGIERGESTTICFQLVTGSLSLRLEIRDGTAIVRCALDGMEVAPRSVEAIGWGELIAVTKVFKQGHGLCGNSGLLDLKQQVDIESFQMVSCLTKEDCGITVWSADGSRFESKHTITQGHGESGFRLISSFRTERIPLADGRLDLPDLKLIWTSDSFDSMREAAFDVAATMGARPIRPPSYHWCSWYYLYHNLDVPTLNEYLLGLEGMKPPPKRDFVQIDAGYFPSAGDWLEPTPRFPDGMKPAFDRIRESGYRPGIWIGPFMVGNRSKLFKSHPDWLLRDAENKLVTPWRHYGEPKVWGYRDEETYVLDTSHPEAFEYLRIVFRSLRASGAEMFKTDFMYWGMSYSDQVSRHVPGKTGVEYFRELLAMIRKEIGDDSFWLGCIAPFFPFVGYADAMRIAGDVGASWDTGFGPQSMLTESVGNQHLNQALWQNDPDVLLIRDFHSDLTDDEVTSLALWQSILGGMVATSDPLHEISADRLALWDFVRPPSNTSIASFPRANQPDRPLTALRELSSGDQVILLFNTANHPVCDRLTLEALGLEGPRFVFRRTPTSSTRVGHLKELIVELRPHEAGVYHLSVRDAIPTGPMVI